MNEVKAFSGLLLALLAGAYVSWTKTPESRRAETKVELFAGTPDAIEGLRLVSSTATVSVGFKKGEDGIRYPWFTYAAGKVTRGFTANKSFEERLASFAPFMAVRSLGVLSPSELKSVGLSGKGERKFTITTRSQTRIFEVGGRTHGARDHYVRPEGRSEVYLVEARVLGDLEFPDGHFMQRRLVEASDEKTEKVIVADSLGRTRTLVRRSDDSPAGGFWALESSPDTPNETWGNYLDKLMKLSASEYLDDTTRFEAQYRPILEAQWFGKDGKVTGAVTLAKEGEGKNANYAARSMATRAPVKVARFTAEQLEHDLGSVLDDAAPTKPTTTAPTTSAPTRTAPTTGADSAPPKSPSKKNRP
ncbi:MAG: DUF4340 domain-containing protein [Deltaproteobacteria bacterium]|nr:DUF4340 domain-containing protein [Deltaproteobacteria bacterium]